MASCSYGQFVTRLITLCAQNVHLYRFEVDSQAWYCCFRRLLTVDVQILLQHVSSLNVLMTCSKKLYIIVGSYILYLTRKGRFRVYVYVLSDSHPAPSAYPVARLSTVRTPEWRHERPTPAGAPHFTLLPTSLMCVETSWRIE